LRPKRNGPRLENALKPAFKKRDGLEVKNEGPKKEKQKMGNSEMGVTALKKRNSRKKRGL